MATRVSEVRRGTGLLREDDDRALVLAFQEGEPDAFATIYRRYRPLAGAVCLRILGNREDAEEAAQETMLRVLQGLPRFNGRYQLAAWVARIATNVSLDALRARSRRPVNGGSTDEIEELRVGGTEDPLELVERLFEREQVRAVLEELPPHHREALVLREFEGRSHREIGERLGITPAQAKALIHRAKGTFRRAWDGDGRHRGLAALLPLFLWPARLPGALRRLFGQAHDAAGAAGSGAAAQAAASVASSPAVAANAPGLAERLTATAVTVLVVGSVGGVGVGAAVVKGRSERAASKASTAEAVSPAPPAVLLVAPEPEPRRGADPGRGARRHQRHEEGERGGREGVAPAAETSEEPSTGTAPGAEPGPSPSPTPAPIPPAPAWTFSFGAGWPSVENCGCDPTPRLVSASTGGTIQDGFTFSQVVEGAVRDAQGDPAWSFHLEFSGRATGVEGSLEHRFALWSLAGPYSYAGEASLVGAAVGEDGAVTYTFVGSYALDEGQEPVAGVPQRGTLTVSLSVWPDGTLFGGSFTLTEASG